MPNESNKTIISKRDELRDKRLKSKSKRMPNMSKLEKLEVTLMKNLLLLRNN